MPRSGRSGLVFWGLETDVSRWVGITQNNVGRRMMKMHGKTFHKRCAIRTALVSALLGPGPFLFRPGHAQSASQPTHRTEGFGAISQGGQGIQVYVASNVGPLTPTSREDAWRNVTWYERVGDKWKKHEPAPETCRAPNRFEAPAVTTQSAEDACESVLRYAGAKVRDADDIRVVEEVRGRTGQVGRGPRDPHSGGTQRSPGNADTGDGKRQE